MPRRVLVSLLVLTAGSGIARAAQTTISISMTAPPNAPHIPPTFVPGAVPVTPPMGWNSYDSYGASITESEVLQQAQALKALLQPDGWSYVIVDYRWYDGEDKIDSNGRFLPSAMKYPSATGSSGFTSLASSVHALGLGFGIHIMRGIPRAAVTANAPIAGSTYRASDAADTGDACPWDQHMWGVRGDMPAGQAWYDALFAEYAQWGVDFVKIDDMLNNTTKTYHQAEANAIRAAVGKTGRAMVISFSPGPDDPSWLPSAVANLNANADMWRIVDDFWDQKAITDLPGVFRAAGTWQGVAGLTAGHWPDADMLPLGYLGPRCEWHASAETTFTRNQQVTILSLWSILPSPLMFGGNVQSLMTDATTGPWTLALLTNEEVLAVNQDAAGTHAKRVSQSGSTEVWARDLSGGRKAVALFNNGTADATVAVTFAALGVSGAPAVRDLWQRADVTGMTTGLSVNVPYGAAAMYVLSPPSAGSGGAGGAGSGGAAGRTGQGGMGAAGTVGTGGVPVSSGGAPATGGTASGGMVGSGGSIGSGGLHGAGGTVGSGGKASGGASSGGSPATGGASQTGGSTGGVGTGGVASAASGSSSGCNCAVASDDRLPYRVSGLSIVGLMALVFRARRAARTVRCPLCPRTADRPRSRRRRRR